MNNTLALSNKGVEDIIALLADADQIFREKVAAACKQYELDEIEIEAARRRESNDVASAITVLNRLTVLPPRSIDQLYLNHFKRAVAHSVSRKQSVLKQKAIDTRDEAIIQAYDEWLARHAIGKEQTEEKTNTA